MWQRNVNFQQFLGWEFFVADLAPFKIRNADGHVAEIAALIEYQR